MKQDSIYTDLKTWQAASPSLPHWNSNNSCVFPSQTAVFMIPDNVTNTMLYSILQHQIYSRTDAAHNRNFTTFSFNHCSQHFWVSKHIFIFLHSNLPQSLSAHILHWFPNPLKEDFQEGGIKLFCDFLPFFFRSSFKIGKNCRIESKLMCQRKAKFMAPLTEWDVTDKYLIFRKLYLIRTSWTPHLYNCFFFFFSFYLKP